MRNRKGAGALLMVAVAIAAGSLPLPAGSPGRAAALGPIGATTAKVPADPVLYWNAVMLQACANDYNPLIVAMPDQKGPTRTSRAFAIVHAAIYDAVNSIERSGEPYLVEVPCSPDASVAAAVAVAAHTTLCVVYPSQRAMFDQELAQSLAGLDPLAAWMGSEVGLMAAWAILVDRSDDGSSQGDGPYTPINLPGYHQPDPLHPNQGFLTPNWGRVRPFVLATGSQFQAPGFVGVAPAARLGWLQGPAYASAFNEVKSLGSQASAARTADQTVIGIFWSYDGSPGLGTPPRLYNQVIRTLVAAHNQSVGENARLFAMANFAMADAAITAWDSKYLYQFWRPIVGIRQADGDGNPSTVADPNWVPLGAQADNDSGTNFSPAFPSYTSGHATIGSSMFQVLKRYFGRDDVAFTLHSDEFNGITRDQNGFVRPALTRNYTSFSEAEQENHDSRIYLGVHWRFDQDQGLIAGEAVGNYVFDHAFDHR